MLSFLLGKISNSHINDPSDLLKNKNLEKQHQASFHQKMIKMH